MPQVAKIYASSGAVVEPSLLQKFGIYMLLESPEYILQMMVAKWDYLA